jgi:hypothetical protein
MLYESTYDQVFLCSCSMVFGAVMMLAWFKLCKSPSALALSSQSRSSGGKVDWRCRNIAGNR